MYIDATSLAAAGRRFEVEVSQLIRTALHPFELQLERVQVQVRSSPEGHVCRLHAWAGRGQTVVIESSGSSRLGAVETAAGSLRRTIASRKAASDAEATPPPNCGGASGASESSVRCPRVLLALHELDASNACLQWARALADALQAGLDVCRVLPNLPALTGSPSGKLWLEATRRLLAATRETRRWCADVLPDAKLSERLIAGGADCVEKTALCARQGRADWIVMPDVHDGCGKAATALARAAGCPVLVARAPTSRSTLLVATDVSDDLHTICSRAAALAEALHAPVLAFHDAAFRPSELSSRVNTLTDVWAQIQAERMQANRHQRLPDLEVLLAHGTDRLKSILDQARREDAEILIVGVSEGGASAYDELAAAVVDRAIRSVLVVPSNLARGAQRHGNPADEADEAQSTLRGEVLERRRWPRSGVQAHLSNDPPLASR